MNPGIRVGAIVEIRPAYSMETGARTEHDDITWCEATVLEVRDGQTDVRVAVKGRGEEWVHHMRLKPARNPEAA